MEVAPQRQRHLHGHEQQHGRRHEQHGRHREQQQPDHLEVQQPDHLEVQQQPGRRGERPSRGTSTGFRGQLQLLVTIFT